MKTVFSSKHKYHSPAREILCGQVTDYFEKPERAELVLEAVKARNFGEVVEPEAVSFAPVTEIHDPAYIDFLRTAYEHWQADGHQGDVFASAYNVQHPGAEAPRCAEGRVGFYTADGSVPITKTSWNAIENSALTALTGQKLIAGGERAAFALCRPPGHHATRAVASGYCFINNAAAAAQAFINDGAGRVAVLDIDYHHGNGTQDIFYSRKDVLFVSIHADPADEYPYFRGHSHEKGEGEGEGFTVNYALPLGTDFTRYTAALEDALTAVTDYAPDALVISLGVDTYKLDPISQFKLESENYKHIGKAIAGANCPTLFVMEGGYAIGDVGTNVANVLSGFLEA
ncbi:MAG: histone deacetylase family protein [Rhodospirillales bacterium]|nr:histone deacetylase family protein [Rhodospirillales bacterium]MCB9995856.1 histone deacetylase family protein [Rhodospirillales bacterium]